MALPQNPFLLEYIYLYVLTFITIYRVPHIVVGGTLEMSSRTIASTKKEQFEIIVLSKLFTNETAKLYLCETAILQHGLIQNTVLSLL